MHKRAEVRTPEITILVLVLVRGGGKRRQCPLQVKKVPLYGGPFSYFFSSWGGGGGGGAFLACSPTQKKKMWAPMSVMVIFNNNKLKPIYFTIMSTFFKNPVLTAQCLIIVYLKATSA